MKPKSQPKVQNSEQSTTQKRRKVDPTFDQKLFFDLVQQRLGITDYQIAEKLGISRHYYSQYTTARNKLKVATILEWFDILGLDEYDLIRFLKDSRRQAN